jgi:putative ABC transport system substrate-binding protein
MSKKLTLALGTLLLALSFSAEAQQPAKVPRIGCYISAASAIGPREEAFRQGLRDLGYIEGQNILLEWRFAKGQEDQGAVAAELVRSEVNIIVTDGNRPTRAAKNATKTIPIVMAVAGDPVGTGIVESLARPGGNVTGLTLLSPELSGKRLEILKETIPKLSRVAVLLNPANPGTALYRKEAQR